MKLTLRPHALAALLIIALAPALHAQRPATPLATESQASPAEAKARPADETPSTPSTPESDFNAYLQSYPLTAKDGPMILVDALLLSAPREKMLPLLPELRDPQRIAAAQAKLLELVAQKEATLIDWLQTTTRDGESSTSEQIVEFRYPVEFANPPKRDSTKEAEPAAKPAPKADPGPLGTIAPPEGLAAPEPTTFETKNIGTTLQTETLLGADGKTVNLRLFFQAVTLLRFQQYQAGRIAVPQPIFNTTKSISILTLRDGARHLFYVGQPNLPEGRMDVVIVGVKVLPPPK